MKKSAGSANILSALSDRSKWAFIILEIAACFTLIYVSVLLDLPRHEYFRFSIVLPLYHAGAFFGYTGGLISGITAALLFVPIIPLDSFVKADRYGVYSAAATAAMAIVFGTVIGGLIGRRRKTRNELASISEMFLRIASETDERDVMLRAAGEARILLNSECAAALYPKDSASVAAPDAWRSTFVDSSGMFTDNDEQLTPEHPLVWTAAHKASLATNSVPSDPRFRVSPSGGSAKSILTAPAVCEGEVYGAILTADKKRGEPFTNRDLDMLRMLSGAAGSAIRNIEQERRRQEEKLREEQMKDLFSRFVSSSVADYILEHPELLAGRRLEVTILVSDIRDFTGIAETMPPQKLVARLNEYFTKMVDVVMEHGGTIDKFIGDCIIAYWGAPAPDPDHQANAVRAALGMASALDNLNRGWDSAGTPPFNAGIAIHTGDVLIGNLGDDRKMVFSILGEEVDSAIRLESLTKTFNTRIIVSGATAKELGGEFTLEKLSPTESDSGESDIFRLNIA